MLKNIKISFIFGKQNDSTPKIMKSTIAKIFGMLLLILFTAGVFMYGYLVSLKPQMEGELAIDNLANPVKVLFDEYGIPHIYAQSETDAYRSLGYLHAQERLFQMEMIRRVASGRLSEILGKDFIETDKLFRTLGMEQIAEKSAQTFFSTNSLPYQQAANAYLDGINQFIASNKTPIEFTILDIPKAKFTPKDCYLVSAYMAFGFAQAFRTDPLITKIYQKLGKDYYNDLLVHSDSSVLKIPVMQQHAAKPTAGEQPNLQAFHPAHNEQMTHIAALTTRITEMLPVPLFHGSNGWIISGAKSKSGKPLLSNDAHIGYSQPAVWYEAHLEYPNQRIYGNHLAGIPFAVIGHNDVSGWGITMFENDDADFFQEKVNPENPNQVWENEKWVNLTVRKEVIKVKNDKEVTFEVRNSKHGAIINDVLKDVNEINTAPVAVWWTMTQQPNAIMQAIYKLGHSRTLSEAQEAVSTIDAPGVNVMYANQKGDIAWWAAAKIPNRPSHVNSMLILDGASGKDEPNGYYNFTENPQNINPEKGYLYSANNQPDSVNGVLHSGYYLTDDRAKRIVQLLEDKKEKWGAEDMKVMITDATSATVQNHIKLIFSIIEEKSAKSDTLKLYQHPAIEILKKWDGNHQVTDIAPTIYHKFLYFITEGLFLDELGEKDFTTLHKTHLLLATMPKLFANKDAIWWDNRQTDDKIETRKEILTQAFNKTIENLESQLGGDTDKWTWGKVHLLEHKHPLGVQKPLNYFFNVGTFGMNGGAEVINNVKALLTKDATQQVAAGPSKRIIIDFADVENAVSVLPTGQSGNFMSKHYADQAPLYNEGKFRKMMMNKEEIEKTKASELLFIKK
ncbi:MAG: penicillin acylase family protein [Cytophagales bacterium]|nr:MAG: penicillin acylase family protein [Cytophagales bacterium]